jgi:hypothetical protein
VVVDANVKNVAEQCATILKGELLPTPAALPTLEERAKKEK